MRNVTTPANCDGSDAPLGAPVIGNAFLLGLAGLCLILTAAFVIAFLTGADPSFTVAVIGFATGHLLGG